MSSQILYAFKENSSKSRFFSKNPMCWDISSNSFIYISTKKHFSIIRWHLNMIFMLGVGYLGSTFAILCVQLMGSGEKMDAKDIILEVLFGILGSFGEVVYISIIIFGKEAAFGFNMLLQTHMKLFPRKCKYL